MRAGSRSAVWAPQGGDGQKQVLELSTLPGVEKVALAPSQGHQRPRRAARRRRRTTMIERMENVGIVVDDLAAATEFFVGHPSSAQARWDARRAKKRQR